MKIIVATMVKDEADIVEYWLRYYGKIFGYNNLFVIDNFSTDGTFEICKRYVGKGVRLYREKDYKLKGEFMTYFKNNLVFDFFFPVDIDEFIVHIDNNNKLSIQNIIKCFNQLKKNEKIYKFKYINPIKTDENDLFLKKFNYGAIHDLKNFNKSFLGKYKLVKNINIDMGNHINVSNYHQTDLYLVHYTNRGIEQFKKKIFNNIKGLGYKVNIDELNKIIELNPQAPGNHHIWKCVKLLKNESNNFEPKIKKNIDKDSISLIPLVEYILKC